MYTEVKEPGEHIPPSNTLRGKLPSTLLEYGSDAYSGTF